MASDKEREFQEALIRQYNIAVENGWTFEIKRLGDEILDRQIVRHIEELENEHEQHRPR